MYDCGCIEHSLGTQQNAPSIIMPNVRMQDWRLQASLHDNLLWFQLITRWCAGGIGFKVLSSTSVKWACKMFCHCMFRATINTVSCYKFLLRRAGWQHINSVSSHDIWMAHIFYQASLMTNHHRHTGWEHWHDFNKYPLLFSCSCNHINIRGNSTRAYSAVHVQCTRASIQPCTVIWLCPS